MEGLRVATVGKVSGMFVPLTKRDDAQRMVYGYASTEAKDYDGDVITRAAMTAALPDYITWGNIREMHQLSAVGVTKDATVDDKGIYIAAKIVDDNAWKKVCEGVYKGFSIGGKATSRDKSSPHIIDGLSLVEISLVDRPANPEAKIDAFKAAGLDKSLLAEVDEPATVTPTVADLRKKLLSTIEGLSDEDVRKTLEVMGDPDALAAADDQPAPAAETPTPVADKVAAVAEPVKPKSDAQKIAERMLAGDSGFIAKVGAAVGLSDKQMTGTLKLPVVGLANWLGNNPGFIENIKKSVDIETAPVLKATVEHAEKAERARGLSQDHKDKAAAHFEMSQDEDDTHDKAGDAHHKVSQQYKEASEHFDAGRGDAGDKAMAAADNGAEAAQKLTQAAEAVGNKAATADDTKAKDSKPDGDYGPHADAGYADPGYQADKKPRYPLKEDGKASTGRIRAAWTYINKDENQTPYSAAQVDKIKAKIIAAWKAAIDAKGPPSAQDDKAKKAVNPLLHKGTTDMTKLGSPDAKGNIAKGLYMVSSAICLLQELSRIQKSLAAEAAVEGDGSALPQRFADLVKMMSDAVRELLAEETSEMLEDREAPAMDCPPYIAYAKKAEGVFKALGGTADAVTELTKALGDRTGSPNFERLTAFADALTKAAAKNADAQTQEWGGKGKDSTGDNDSWKKAAQDIHDKAVGMGAMCKAASHTAAKAATDDPDMDDDANRDPGKPKDDKKDTKKAAAVSPAEDVGKQLAAAVTTAMAPLASAFESLKGELDELRKNRRDPALPGKGVLTVVEKGQDVTTDGKKAAEDDKDPKSVLKGIHASPRFMSGRG